MVGPHRFDGIQRPIDNRFDAANPQRAFDHGALAKATLPGTATHDLDGDGDNDVVLVSMFNAWYRDDTASLVWLENDGHQQFTHQQIASSPTHLVTVATGDINGDRQPDIVAGGWHVIPPFRRLGGVTTWINGNGDRK